MGQVSVMKDDHRGCNVPDNQLKATLRSPPHLTAEFRAREADSVAFAVISRIQLKVETLWGK